MVPISIIIIYFMFFISAICAASTCLKLYLSGKNYLIAVLAGAMSVGEVIILFSVIWIDDFQHNVPKTFCIVQALAFQYAVYLQIIAAVCFSFHIYQLLVRCKQGSSQTLQKIYVASMVGGPIIMTVIAGIVSVKLDSIGPLAINCDIKKPTWVRLIGYSGFNFALTLLGVPLSARAAYEVFKHLDQFKSQISNGGSQSNDSTTPMTPNSIEIRVQIDSNHESSDVETTETTTVNETRNTITSFRRPRTQNREKQIKAYNMTKAAAIRMVLFSSGFALINVLGAFQTFTMILQDGLFGQDETKGIGGNDLAGAFMGLMIFLVFGLPRSVKRFFSRKK